MKITVEALVNAPIDVVWKKYTDPEDITKWNAASDDWHTTAATVDLRVGGVFNSRMEAKDGSMGFDFAGKYLRVEPNSLLEYEFGDRRAQIDFIETPEGVRVIVTFDPENVYPEDQQRQGWQAILNNFAAYASN